MPSQFTQVHSVKKFRFNTRKKDVAGNEYVYLKGVGSTVAGSWVTFDELGVTALTGVGAIGLVAVAQAAVDAATKFGWYCVAGTTTGLGVAGGADNTKVFVVATAGTVDDAGAAGDQVVGAIARSAVAAGSATFQLNYPVVGVNVA